jgi:hypothetical protein
MGMIEELKEFLNSKTTEEIQSLWDSMDSADMTEGVLADDFIDHMFKEKPLGYDPNLYGLTINEILHRAPEKEPFLLYNI